MAGRPVAARGGGGLLYGLIAFVIVAVAGIGGFVWQLTSNEALRSASDSNARRLTQYGTPLPYYLNEATARGSSAFSVMQKDIEDLAFLTTGKRDAVRPAIVESSNRLLQEVAATTPSGTIEASDTLHTALRKLHTAYVDLQAKHVAQSTDLEEQRLHNERLLEGLGPGMHAFCGIPSTFFVQGLSDSVILDCARRIMDTLGEKAILNVGDILPINGDIEQVRRVAEMVESLNKGA